jgi:Lrp/AsnC family transcriptional regulator, regulator for asnA, asnC and gidA
MFTKDQLDENIIALIGIDCRQSSKILAEKLNVSPATIRRRLGRLVKNGILHYVAAVDSTKLPNSTVVVIAMDVDRNKIKLVTDTLMQLPEFKWVATTTGRFDILATAYLTHSTTLSEFLEKKMGKIEGIKDSEIFVCMDIKKGHLIPVGQH